VWLTTNSMLVTELLAPGCRLTDKQGASWVLYGEPTHGLRPPIKLRSVEPLLNGPRREVVYEIYAYIGRLAMSGHPEWRCQIKHVPKLVEIRVLSNQRILAQS